MIEFGTILDFADIDTSVNPLCLKIDDIGCCPCHRNSPFLVVLFSYFYPVSSGLFCFFSQFFSF